MKTITTPKGKDFNSDDRNKWIEGYKAAQQKGVYSEADMRKYHNIMCLHGNVAGEKFIQSLNQEPIELETECGEPRECSCDSNGDCLMPVIKTIMKK